MCSCIHVQYLITSETTFLAPKVLAKISTAWASGATRCSKCCNIWTTFRLTPRRVVYSSVQCSLLWYMYMQSVARVVLLHLASYSVKLTDCLQCYTYHQSTASSDFKTAQMYPIGITCITLQCGPTSRSTKIGWVQQSSTYMQVTKGTWCMCKQGWYRPLFLSYMAWVWG